MQVTEEYLKDNFLTAHFIDNERQNIEIQATSEDKKKVYTYVIPYDENRDEYKALMTMITLDQLHEYTYQRVKNERRLFEEQVIRIAQKDGLIMDSERIDTKFYPTLVNSLFEEQDNADHVFALKLALFELDAIKNSENEEAKKELRKSKDKLDILSAAIQCLRK
jgi:hypothetical protein